MNDPIQDDRTEADDLELAEALEDFHRRLESGEDPDPAQVLHGREHLRDLEDCLAGLAALEGLREAMTGDEPAEASPAEETLGEYDIVREIGRGGMGVVYEARDRRLGRRVALKMIKVGDLAGPEELRRFHVEAQTVAGLQHPNIVQIFELGEHQGRPFMVLELVVGQGLDRRLRESPLPAAEAAALVAVLARAMHFAHGHGVIHRDLKPSNILVQRWAPSAPDARERTRTAGTPTGPEMAAGWHWTPETLKITDFGLAKRLDGADHTASGAILGTPSYMAPEQAAGRGRVVDARTDVYALGAILYEAVTGRPPFKAATAAETLAQVLFDEPAAPRRVQPHLAVDLETICLKCLDKDPARRYADALALAEDLESFTRGEPIAARPVSRLEKVRRWCVRHPAPAALGGLVLLLALGLAILLQQHLKDATSARARAAGRREEILRSNAYAAKGMASTVLLQFQHLAEKLLAASEDPTLRDLLAAKDLPGLQAHFDRLGAAGTGFHSWHVLDAQGTLLADAPLPFEEEDRSFPGQDYFRGAMARAGKPGLQGVHISRLYRSANDGLFKITMARTILGKNGPLGVICATLPTSATIGSMQLNDERRIGVLVGRRDTHPPRGPAPKHEKEEYLIILHPAYGKGNRAVTVPRESLRRLPQPRPGSEFLLPPPAATNAESVHAAYEDPLAEEEPAYAGRWLAGFAPVGNTEFLVIVQQRDDLKATPEDGRLPVLLAGAAALLGALAFGWWYRRRPAESPPHPSTPPAPDDQPTQLYQVR